MRTRVITAIVALLIFIPFVVIGGVPLMVLASLLGIMAISEISMMRKRYLYSVGAIISMIGVVILILPNSIWRLSFLPDWVNSWNVVYGLIMIMLAWTVASHNNFNFDDVSVLSLAIFYIGTGFHYFVKARETDYRLLVFALIIIWGTDTFAYLIGRSFGKHKLIPKISPNKTWEGSVGGTIVAAIAASAYAYFSGFAPVGGNIFMMIIFAILLSIAGQIGDLVESAFKRHYRVKDSGNILPGHGGILDRFDSLLFVMPLTAVLGVF